MTSMTRRPALRLLNDGLGRPLGPVELVSFAILAAVPLAFEVI
jgi:hypothetical protein